MNKFIKISTIMVLVIGVFVGVSNVVYKDKVHAEYYSVDNRKEVTITLESEEETKQGKLLNISIKNNSKYVYRIREAKVVFPTYIKEDDGSETTTDLLKLDLYRPFEDEYAKNDTMWYGIQPYETGHIKFLIPKGIKLDKDYFRLDDVRIDLDYSYTVDMPFSDNGYFSISGGNSSTELDIELD